MPIETWILIDPILEPLCGDRKRRCAIQPTEGRAVLKTEPQPFAGFRSRRTIPDFVDRARFLGCQAGGWITGAGGGTCLVMAGARILNDAVGNTIKRVTG